MNTDRLISPNAALKIVADVARDHAIRGMRPFDDEVRGEADIRKTPIDSTIVSRVLASVCAASPAIPRSSKRDFRVAFRARDPSDAACFKPIQRRSRFVLRDLSAGRETRQIVSDCRHLNCDKGCRTTPQKPSQNAYRRGLLARAPVHLHARLRRRRQPISVILLLQMAYRATHVPAAPPVCVVWLMWSLASAHSLLLEKHPPSRYSSS
jgi:hypothetical protein